MRVAEAGDSEPGPAPALHGAGRPAQRTSSTGRVLVLNASYEPINVCTVRRAAVLILKNRAEILEEGVVVTPTMTAAEPALNEITVVSTVDLSDTLPAYGVLDLSGEWRRGNLAVVLFVNNAANTRSYGAGHVAFGEQRYYVLQPVNTHLLVRLRM